MGGTRAGSRHRVEIQWQQQHAKDRADIFELSFISASLGACGADAEQSSKISSLNLARCS
jgi:hypothetical protein